MTRSIVALAAAFFVIANVAATAADAPMPQTRGMQGMDPKMHDPANRPTVTCKPKPGTEAMQHSGKDHSMPDTRGMKGMDPAMHMQDCESSDQPAPVEKPVHQHKTPGQS